MIDPEARESDRRTTAIGVCQSESDGTFTEFTRDRILSTPRFSSRRSNQHGAEVTVGDLSAGVGKPLVSLNTVSRSFFIIIQN